MHNFDEEIRTLSDIKDGLAFVEVLSRLVPAGYDLIDILEKLDKEWSVSFGSWREIKDINATLRTYAEWREREGSKAAALLHPLGNRANTVIQLNGLYDVIPLAQKLEYLRLPADFFKSLNADTDLAQLIQQLPTSCIISRLIIEIRILNLFIKQKPEWLRQLYAEAPAHELEEKRKYFEELKQLTVSACNELLQHLLDEFKNAKQRG